MCDIAVWASVHAHWITTRTLTSLKIQPLTPNLLPTLKMSFELNGLLQNKVLMYDWSMREQNGYNSKHRAKSKSKIFMHRLKSYKLSWRKLNLSQLMHSGMSIFIVMAAYTYYWQCFGTIYFAPTSDTCSSFNLQHQEFSIIWLVFLPQDYQSPEAFWIVESRADKYSATIYTLCPGYLITYKGYWGMHCRKCQSQTDICVCKSREHMTGT